MTKKITVADLIDRKNKKILAEKNVRLYIPSLDGEIVIKSPDHALAAEFVSKASTAPDEADRYAVYQCVVEPNLKDKELQEAYGCIEPTDIVTKIFLPGEITAISTEILKLSGFQNGVRVIEEVKK